MRSISKTITVTIIISIGLILALGQVAIDFAVTRWLTEQFDTAMEARARALVTLTKFDGSEVELDFADEFMPEFEAPAEPQYFELFLGDGSLLERSHSFDENPALRSADQPDRAAPTGHRFPGFGFEDQSDEVVFTDLRLPDGRMGRRVAIKFIVQIENEDELLEDLLEDQIPLQDRPRAIVRFSRERESLDRTRQHFHLFIIGITLIILLAVVVSVPRLTRAGLRPLIRMKDEIGAITPQTMDHRVTDRGQPIEIEPIASQFNLVLDEIEKAFIRERQFSSDVAHELRTPVAEIRSLAEVGLRWPDEKDIRTYFGDIHESAQHLDRLIENLLYLCRSEEGNIEIVVGDVDLGKLLDEIRASLAAECESRAIRIDPPANAPPVVVADPQWLELILQNLLSNAVSHSPNGANLGIEIDADGGYCRLEIHNPMAIPLTAEDIDHVFQRFWRKDTARETGRHAGIGLSLVKSYADLMGFDIDAWVADGRFHIALSRIEVSGATTSPPAG